MNKPARRNAQAVPQTIPHIGHAICRQETLEHCVTMLTSALDSVEDELAKEHVVTVAWVLTRIRHGVQR